MSSARKQRAHARGLLTAALAMLWGFCPITLHAQEVDPGIIQQEFNDAADAGDDELRQRWDELEALARVPLNLRTASAEQLSRLPGIAPVTARAIIEFVDRTMPADIADLAAVPQLDAEQLLTLNTYTFLPRKGGTPVPPAVDLRTRITVPLVSRSAYTEQLYRVHQRHDPTGDSTGLDTIPIASRYLGSPQAYMLRAAVRADAISGALVFEKDQGEPIFIDDTLDYRYTNYEYADRPADRHTVRHRFAAFLSGHVAAKVGAVSMVFGDYQAEFGQGLALWTSYPRHKGSDPPSLPEKSGRGIVGSASVDETRFLRGVALTYDGAAGRPIGPLLAVFGSVRRLDASTEGVGAGGDTTVRVTTLRSDGYRRTHSELRRGGNLEERLLGLHLRMRSRTGSLGLTLYSSRFSLPLASPAYPGITGNATGVGALDATFMLGPAHAFAEIALAPGGASGVVPGAVAGVSGNVAGLNVTAAGRYLPERFSMLHGTGFGESPIAGRNEQGFYIGMEGRIMQRLRLEAYGDLFTTAARTATVPFPRAGADGMLRLAFTATNAVSFDLRVQAERKIDALTVPDSLERERRRLYQRTRHGVRFGVSYAETGDLVRLRVGFELVGAAHQGLTADQAGLASTFEARYRPRPDLVLTGRVTLFETTGADATIYRTEADVAGSVRTVALAGHGRRAVLALRYRISGSLVLSAAYSETAYVDRSAIHPGTPDAVAGNVENGLTLQLSLQL